MAAFWPSLTTSAAVSCVILYALICGPFLLVKKPLPLVLVCLYSVLAKLTPVAAPFSLGVTEIAARGEKFLLMGGRWLGPAVPFYGI